MNLLAAYDCLLALGAIYVGIMMITSSGGIFTEYPKEWLTRLPFTSWVMPGILAIIPFGAGNSVAGLFAFSRIGGKPWLLSAIMGILLLFNLITQTVILGQWYLATGEFFILSIGQLCLSGFAYVGCKKETAQL
jgi:hypothetical protein